MLAVGAGAAAAAPDAARQPIQGRIEPARGEFIPRLDLLATFPPVRVLRLEYILRGRFGGWLANVVFGLTAVGQPLAFFLVSDISPEASVVIVSAESS